MSSSFINKVYQDKKGFIWIATENGLNRFDDTKFLVYNKIQDDSTSLKSSYVRTLFEDSSGNLSHFSSSFKDFSGMPPKECIAGKVAVITGTGGVLGGSIAKSFIDAGAKVVALDIRQVQLDERVKELTANGGFNAFSGV